MCGSASSHTHTHTHTQDLLNLEPESSFEEKFFLFRSTVRPLERRLAAALKHIFDHCPTLMAELRVLEMFQGVCRRETIKVREQTRDIYFLGGGEGGGRGERGI